MPVAKGGKSTLTNWAGTSDAQERYASKLKATVQYRSVCGKCGARRVDQQIGLEATPDEFVARLVEVFREVKRVLHPTGTLWLNLGDSYANFNHAPGGKSNGYVSNHKGAMDGIKPHSGTIPANCKPKDLIGIPWMVAFALRADGWWLRSAITWCKGNPMPESVTDRPTSATEMVFMLAKSERYFYDADAIRERHQGDSGWAKQRANGVDTTKYSPNDALYGARRRNEGERGMIEHPAGRNKRNWWLINSEPYPGSHYATFPSKLVEPCVLSGSSAYGVCAGKIKKLKMRGDLIEWQREITTAYLRDRKRADRTEWDTGEIPVELREYFEEIEVQCLSPWQRVVEREAERYNAREGVAQRLRNQGASNGGTEKVTLGVTEHVKRTTTGWTATCQCQADVVPATVLDPFFGSGTVASVALKFGRHFVGIDLDPRNLALATQRIEQTQPMLLEVT